jgi:hypothetical protein
MMTASGPSTRENAVVAAFLPLHKRALGVAFAVVGALVVFVVTAVYLIRRPEGIDLTLLSNYFAGYTVSWAGAFIGAAWAAFAGYVAGWFLAFTRNFALAVTLLIVRSRAEMAQTRDFLDHI